MEQQPALFDVKNHPLRGKTLVEASAGTGKTYSIAILILRMVMEENIPVNEILVVTFTKAAVAELQERIRRFIKMAYQYASGSGIEDGLIRSLIDDAPDKIKLQERLKAALYSMDEANILTIHAFSQQILNRFAFETGQPFNGDLQNDISGITEAVLNDFWRKEITALPPGILEAMGLEKYKTSLSELFDKQLNGIRYLPYEEQQHYDNAGDLINAFTEIKDQIKEEEEKCAAYFDQHKDELFVALNANSNSKKAFENTWDDFHKFLAAAVEKAEKNYMQQCGEAFLNIIRQIQQLGNARANIISELKIFLKCKAIEYYIPQIAYWVQHNDILTFDAMIRKLHDAVVVQKKERLVQLIRQNFRAVCIDEFQDTDRVQFEIFEALFMDTPDIILFLIGDPKQSIYAFRNADVDNYLDAKARIPSVTMRVNFRSTQEMVHAANLFFQLVPDTFAYGDNKRRIDYEVVTAHDSTHHVYQNGQLLTDTIEMLGYANADAVNGNIAAQVSFLLNTGNGFQLTDKKSGLLRPIRPADIGILVATRRRGKEIKEALQGLNIPAIQLLDEKVLQSDEAKDIIYILEAMLSPGSSTIRRALYATFINVQNALPLTAGAIDDDTALELFRSYQVLANEEKVYQAFEKLLNDFSIRQYYTGTTQQLRILSNIEQIIQLINEQQHQRGLSLGELLLWLRKSRSGRADEVDAYTTRIESDEDAVKIVTIHASKGLEYNIVVACGLDSAIGENNKADYTRFKANGSENAFKERGTLSEAENEAFITQEQQEKRRLLYVAVTRAVYRCYICFSRGTGKQAFPVNTTLTPFLQNVHNNESLALYQDREVAAIPYNYTAEAASFKVLQPDYDALQGSRSYWWKMSYTALAQAHEIPQYEYKESELPDYDDFVFNRLPRGAGAGLKLHTLFEETDFTIDTENIVDDTVKKLLDSFNETSVFGKATDNSAYIQQLLGHTLNAIIHVGSSLVFSLKNISNEKRLSELEFNFNVNAASWESIASLLEQNKAELKYLPERFPVGMMNGKIDLFFEHHGRYYILDWKSNYLGSNIENYTGQNLVDAMTANNYHLQYLIYTVAIHKYLRQRIAGYDYEKHFGGVVYVFLRGARAGSSSGIFSTKPDLETINGLERLLEISRQIL